MKTEKKKNAYSIHIYTHTHLIYNNTVSSLQLAAHWSLAKTKQTDQEKKIVLETVTTDNGGREECT